MLNKLIHRNIHVLLILFLGFILRLVALDQSLWLDEGIEWWGVTAFGLRKLLTGYMLGDFNPPGHHLLMWFWVRVVGDSEIALRMPSVLFGVGTVTMVYAIAKATSDKRQATSNAEQKASSQGHVLRTVLGVLQGPSFPALLAATNGLLIYYSQEARMYAMATFFVTASVWAFLKLEKKFSPKLLTAYCLLLTAALYSHYLTWLMIPVFVIWGFRSFRGIRKIWIVAPTLATVPLWPLLAKQLQNGIASAGNSQWAMLSQTTPKNVALVFVKFVTGRVPFPDDPIWQLVVGVVVVLFWLGVVKGVRDMWRVREQRVIVYWLVMPLALGGMIGLVIPVFSYFRFLFVLPATLLLFGRGVGRFRIFGGVGVVTFLFFSLLYLLVPSNHRENWRGLAEELHQRNASSTVAIFGAVRPPFDYYDRGQSTVMPIELLQFREQFAADPELGTTIWVIPYGKDIFDPDNRIQRFLMSLSYRREFERHFRGTTLELWNH